MREQQKQFDPKTFIRNNGRRRKKTGIFALIF